MGRGQFLKPLWPSRVLASGGASAPRALCHQGQATPSPTAALTANQPVMPREVNKRAHPFLWGETLLL